MAEGFERTPYAHASISSITEKDSNVKIIGTIIKKDKESSSIVLDDGKGAIVVLMPSDDLLEKAVVGKQVRILGVVLPFEGGFELKADIIQDFSKVDKDLYTKIYK